MVNGIWPDIKDQVGVVQLSIFGRQYPQATERTFGPWALTPGLSQKSFLGGHADRPPCASISGSAPCYARGGNPQFGCAANRGAVTCVAIARKKVAAWRT